MASGAAFTNQNNLNIGGQDYSIGAGNLTYSGSTPYVLKNGQYYAVQNGQIASSPSNLAANPGEPTGSGAQIMAGPGNGGNVASTSTASTPIDYSQLLPSASTYASFSPLSYSSFGQVPYTQAAQSSAATVDNSQLPGALQSYEGAVNTAMAPQFQQQQDALTSNLAQRGIFNSSAGQDLQNNLSGQQDASLSSAYSPLIQQFAGAYNSNNQLNANNQQQTALANQTADNNANTYNAGAYGTIAANDQTTYNNYLSQLMGYQNGLQNTLLEGTLNTYSPSQYTNLLSQGLSGASQAYTSALGNGAAGTSNLSSTLGNLAGSFANKTGSTPAVTNDFSGADTSSYSTDNGVFS